MRIIRYRLLNIVNAGIEENSVPIETTVEKCIPYTEANEEIAKAEAYNGEYTVEDDGAESDVVTESDLSVWDELDAAYQAGYDEGYTEGVNAAYDQ